MFFKDLQEEADQAMKIYFCDGCNESLPLSDIKAGLVTSIKGKLFCKNCIPPGGGGGEPIETVVKSRPQPVLLAIVFLLVAHTVYREFQAGSPSNVGYGETSSEIAGRDTDGRFGNLEDDVSSLRRADTEFDRRVDFSRSETEQLRTQMIDVSRAIDQVGVEIDRLARTQAETGQFIERMNLLENRAEVINGRVDTLADMLTDLQDNIALGLAAASEASPGMGFAQNDIAPTVAGELEELRKQLLDPDAGQRFDAVNRVKDGRIKELAGDLLLVLTDEDPFVRIQAMEILGDFGHAEAVPHLLDVLGDPSSWIRKTAAENLVRLTGVDPGYDPEGSQVERDRAVAAWRALVEER